MWSFSTSPLTWVWGTSVVSRTKTRILKGGTAAIASAMLLAIPFIVDREGESLESYRDVVGVWTICHGETAGVKPGQRATKEECQQLTNSRVGQFMTQVQGMLAVSVAPQTLASHTSFAYNVGLAGYARSMTLRETNKGNIAAGCWAMANWYTAGGKDCRIRRNGCYGLVTRRKDEINLCLSGLK